MKRFLTPLVLALAAVISCTPEEPASISIDGKTTYSIDGDARQIVIGVKCNRANWTYDLGAAASWLSANATASGLVVDVSENNSGAGRKAVISFRAEESTANVVINQSEKEVVMTLSCDRIIEVEAAAGSREVTVETNLSSWGYETDADWISLSASANKLTVRFSANPVEEIRSASVRVFAPGEGTRRVIRDFTVRQAEMEVDYGTEVLSEGGNSNCYIISHRGTYKIDATVRGNGKTVSGLAAPSALEPAGAKLVWQSAKGMIKKVSFDSEAKQIVFNAAKVNGNALIAALDGSGKIIWSWHIWFPTDEVTEFTTSQGDTMMSFNLGAMHSRSDDIGSYGLLYQWGRKDPFPGSPLMHGGSITTVGVPVYDIDGNTVAIGSTSMYSTTDNNLAFSIANPTVCISNNQQYASCRDWLKPAESNTALWGNPRGSIRENGDYHNLGSKTYYDPCPKGWRVPSPRSLSMLTKSGGMAWATGEAEGILTWGDLGGTTTVRIADIDADGLVNLKDYKDGWFFILSQTPEIISYFPASTRYDGMYAMLMGSMVGLWGNYWFNAPSLDSDGADTYLGTCMSFGIKDYGTNGPKEDYSVTLSPIANGSRADAYAIRCIKE